MYGMKLDIINGEHQGLIFPAWRLVFPVTPKRIILPVKQQEESGGKERWRQVDVCVLLIFIVDIPSVMVWNMKSKRGVHAIPGTPYKGEARRGKGRTGSLLSLRSNRARTHLRSETRQSF